jgi:hypothetical protein
LLRENYMRIRGDRWPVIGDEEVSVEIRAGAIESVHTMDAKVWTKESMGVKRIHHRGHGGTQRECIDPSPRSG